MPPQRPKAPSIYCHESRPITFTGKQSWIRTIHRTLALAKTLTLHVIFRHLQGRQLKDPIYVFFLKKKILYILQSRCIDAPHEFRLWAETDGTYQTLNPLS